MGYNYGASRLMIQMCCGIIIFSADNNLDKKVLWLIVPDVKEKNTWEDSRVDLIFPIFVHELSHCRNYFHFVIFLKLNYSVARTGISERALSEGLIII